jgi:hypothetical protein
MSKSVRLPDYLAAEVERLASEEKRSLANMVQILLEQALKIGYPREPVAKADAQPLDVPARRVTVPQVEDPHFKPDFK